MWQTIFSIAKKVIDFKKPLTHKILSDPEHPFVMTLIYVYSMESFIFREINKASRDKDISKIKFYGAFASALGYIIHCGNHRHTDFNRSFNVFRGLKVHAQEFNTKFKIGSFISLQGFTSSTLSRLRALQFALEQDPQPLTSSPPNSSPPPPPRKLLPILFHITFTGSTQYFYLNSEDYSAYPHEQEVLLQEGIKYRVEQIEKTEIDFEQADASVRSEEIIVIKLRNVEDKYQKMWWWSRLLRFMME